MRYDVPIFDPFVARGDNYYHPDNDAADHLLQITFTHRDIALLFGMLGRAQDEHETKLLTKFIVVEFLSLDEHLGALVGITLSGKGGYTIKPEEAEELKRLNAAYTSQRKPAEPQLREIRNKVAAHRDRTSLIATARIWDGIDALTVRRLLQPVSPLFDRLRSLGIYQWTKSEQTDKGRVVAFISPLVVGEIVPEAAEAFRSEEADK